MSEVRVRAHIAMLNLMPNKIRTETQIARLAGSTPLQVEMTLLKTGSYKSRNTPEPHLIAFYKTWEEVRHEKFDGLIVTGGAFDVDPALLISEGWQACRRSACFGPIATDEGEPAASKRPRVQQ